jgi:hypothetical protein
MQLDIAKQQNLVVSEQPEITLKAACKSNDGVVQHTDFERNHFINKFLTTKASTTFFIPASGSGSRMFQFLYDFLEEPNEENRGKTEKFLNYIADFAFFDMLPLAMRNRIRNYDIELEDFVSYLLNGEGLGYGKLPKGLIPFHRSGSFILNAFQEHLLQGMKLKEDEVNFHFTIKQAFKERILKSLTGILELTGKKASIETSVQDPATDAVAFDEDGEIVLDENGEPLRRPSGHGALLKNLNGIDADIVFVKNIDNVQHASVADNAIDTMRYLGGVLIKLQQELLGLLDNEAEFHNNLVKFNEKFQLFERDQDLSTLSIEELKDLMKRPLRVCGMVKNEGQPGGGPFWVEQNKMVSKQIVEKAQIRMRGEQYRLMVQSQYFNPVLMALSPKNCFGQKVDLMEFADPSKYFLVQKKYMGKSIRFIERPGLWNGSMANWLTVFVEVPNEVFTPVKTVLDLLQNAHRQK